MKEEIMEILKSIRDDVDFEKENLLIDNGILDSFDIISVVSDLNEKFAIDISVDELEPENFNSIDAIVKLIENMR